LSTILGPGVLTLGLLALSACAASGSVDRYRTATLVGVMRGEETGEVWGTQVDYLTPVEAEQYRLTIRDGLIYDASGAPVETHERGTIFVMTADGRFYAKLAPEVGLFHHSSFTAGGPVAAAGELVVHAGKLEEVSDKSGHYRPPARLTAQAVWQLGCAGVDILHVEVVLEGEGRLPATKLVALQQQEAGPMPACE